MTNWLAIAAYRCEINGAPTGSVDFKIIYHQADAAADVEAFLAGEPAQHYLNDLGETVSWPLSQIIDIQGLMPMTAGREVVGFIADGDDFARWCRKAP